MLRPLSVSFKYNIKRVWDYRRFTNIEDISEEEVGNIYNRYSKEKSEE